MKSLLLAAVLLLQAGPKQEWVVIFNHVGDDKPPTVMNFRLIVHAFSEGEAALVATQKLRKVMDTDFVDKLTFIEAQVKR